ncbi:Fis family transcriptional regulator [Thalassotalea sp. HSM 43]|uniref:RNA ligase family protein n=1 Tax=Thalassotalea sp. HSM 43 TaxID=2552945 RepID=UPI00107FE1F0|nr:RNA ligase family protein [Thalassotalea sp. HSM 43]QBY05365.1 Fis family transcriptional regulator [Thalassotalea sp. HSM 43]
MRKSDKKIDNSLRLVLTEVCEHALKKLDGFQWLTHIVNYNNFPKSLKVFCVFDTNDNLQRYLQSDENQALLTHIEQQLKGLNIQVKNIKQHVFYDTEQNCDAQHNGNWASRLN